VQIQCSFFYLANNPALDFQITRGLVCRLQPPALHDFKPHLAKFFNGPALCFVGPSHVP
jgi:hypothetical protein